MELLNSLKISLNFNLRQPRRKVGESPIFAVLAIGGKQYKIPINAKIAPYLWDGKRQQCRIVSNMTQSDMINATMINVKLRDILAVYNDYFCYLCGNEVDAATAAATIRDNIAATITDDTQMPKRQRKTTATAKANTDSNSATTLLWWAFAQHYRDSNTPTADKKRQHVNEFCQFIANSGKDDTPAYFLSQRGINDYRDCVLSSGNSDAVNNQKMQVIVMLINELAATNKGIDNNISRVTTPKIQSYGKKQKETKKRELTDSEINAVMKCGTLTATENEYRDLFHLLLNVGCRVNDLPKLFNEDYIVTTAANGVTIWTMQTQKENVPQQIHVNDTILAIVNKYRNGMKYVKLDAKLADRFNYYLKKIFAKAGVNTPVNYSVTSGGVTTQHTQPLYEVISTHFARHTFITRKLREGYSASEVAKMAGHKDSKMVEDVYSHLTATDDANAIAATIARVTPTTTPTTTATTATATATANSDTAIIAQQAREIYALKSRISIAEEQLNEMRNTKQQLETQNRQLVDELQIAKKIHFELLMRMSAKTPHLALPYYPPKN